MSNPYIQTTTRQLEEMLKKCGAASIGEIFRDQIPEEYEFRGDFGLPPAQSELELQQSLPRLAGLNRSTANLTSFLGAGIYDHFVPTAIMHVANRSEYVTGYTPYQPEASQGLLQAFFEYQTLISRLYEMPVANASLYDGASALGESIFMSLAVKSDRSGIILPDTLHPDYLALVKTYTAHFDSNITIVPSSNGRYDLDALKNAIGSDTAVVVVQQPNYFGCIEDVQSIADIVHENGALLVSVADPLALGVLATPGECEADIAIGEGQPLGLSQFAGGETLGIFTCRQEFIRKVPGRLVGLAKDKEDRKGFVLTLQTREQHIRRAKATSNICTNHAHNALRATIYMCLMGPQGIARVARACVRNTVRLRKTLETMKPGCIRFDGPSFREIVVTCNRPAAEVRKSLVEKGFLAGVPLEMTLGEKFQNQLLVAVTEKRTDEEIDRFAEVLGESL